MNGVRWEVQLSSLQQLIDHRRLWRARDNRHEHQDGVATGWRALDAALPGYGWPQGAVSELLSARPEQAIRLLQPALTQLSKQQCMLVWVGMPWLPYAPAWQKLGINLSRVLLVSAQGKQIEWAIEQALRLSKGAAVIAALPKLDLNHSRRLQLAAAAGSSYAFLLRPLSALPECNAASVRVQLDAHAQGLHVTVHKRRGAFALPPFVLKKPNQAVQWPMRPMLPVTSHSALSEASWYEPSPRIERGEITPASLWQ